MAWLRTSNGIGKRLGRSCLLLGLLFRSGDVPDASASESDDPADQEFKVIESTFSVDAEWRKSHPALAKSASARMNSEDNANEELTPEGFVRIGHTDSGDEASRPSKTLPRRSRTSAASRSNAAPSSNPGHGNSASSLLVPAPLVTSTKSERQAALVPSASASVPRPQDEDMQEAVSPAPRTSEHWFTTRAVEIALGVVVALIATAIACWLWFATFGRGSVSIVGGASPGKRFHDVLPQDGACCANCRQIWYPPTAADKCTTCGCRLQTLPLVKLINAERIAYLAACIAIGALSVLVSQRVPWLDSLRVLAWTWLVPIAYFFYSVLWRPDSIRWLFFRYEVTYYDYPSWLDDWRSGELIPQPSVQRWVGEVRQSLTLVLGFVLIGALLGVAKDLAHWPSNGGRSCIENQ